MQERAGVGRMTASAIRSAVERGRQDGVRLCGDRTKKPPTRQRFPVALSSGGHRGRPTLLLPMSRERLTSAPDYCASAIKWLGVTFCLRSWLGEHSDFASEYVLPP